MPPETRAAIYARISQDRSGDELGVDRQRADCERLAESRGWHVTRVYTENDVSASGRRPRPLWEELMAEVEAGRVDAVIAWNLDRLCRNAVDRVRLLDAGRQQGLTIALARGSDMDLSTASGRMAADILGAVALNEIETKSERQKAAHRQAAAAGRRIGGHRPFGYEQDGMTVRPKEAEAIIRAYHEYLAAVPLISIARRWNTEGLNWGQVRPDGTVAQWTHSSVRTLLKNPRNAGLRAHRGEIVGKAAWPALVPEHTWRAVVALLDSRSTAAKPRGGRLLLTGIARCGVCGTTVRGGGNKAKGQPSTYRCPSNRHVNRLAGPVDEDVQAFLFEVLSTPEWAAVFVEQERGGDTTGLHLEAERIRSELDTIALERAQRKITPRQFELMNADLLGQLNDVETQMVSTTRATAVTDLVRGGFKRSQWATLDPGQQRLVIATVLDIELFSGGRGVRRPGPETVRMRPRFVTPGSVDGQA